MNKPFAHVLRASLETWEREAAAQWDALVRSPDFLRRVGYQLGQTLQTQQRIAAALQAALVQAATAHEQTARALYLLEQLEQQVAVLAARIDQLQTTLDDE